MNDWIKHELDWLKSLFQILAAATAALIAYAVKLDTAFIMRVLALIGAAMMGGWTLATYTRVSQLLQCLKRGQLDDCK